MVRYIVLVCFFISSICCAASIYKVGDKPKNLCWESLKGKVCIDDGVKAGNVQVLLYSAMWCGPCHAEFKELVPKLERFAAKKVTFISLTAGGVDSSVDPTEDTLRKWETKFAIDKAKASWVVALSPRDPGRYFFDQVLIPSVVILDQNGKVAFKAVTPGVTKIIAEVERLKP